MHRSAPGWRSSPAVGEAQHRSEIPEAGTGDPFHSFPTFHRSGGDPASSARSWQSSGRLATPVRSIPCSLLPGLTAPVLRPWFCLSEVSVCSFARARLAGSAVRRSCGRSSTSARRCCREPSPSRGGRRRPR
ncbi:hypothetical protein [Azospirillum palustre]